MVVRQWRGGSPYKYYAKTQRQEVQTKKRATAVAIDRHNTSATNISVQVQGENEVRKGFIAVFNTTILGAFLHGDRMK